MNVICLLKDRIVLRLMLALLALAAPLQAEKPTATWLHRTLALEIPYHGQRSGQGRLTVELLSPEDEVLAHSERPVNATQGEGLWRMELSPAAPISFEELVWERVRYRFRYDGEAAPAIEQVQPVGDILRRPVMRILGQGAYLSGAQAAIRVVVFDGDSAEARPIAQNGSLRIELMAANEKPRPLFAGRLDRRGSVDAAIRFPTGLTGSYALHLVAETPIGTVESTQTIRLEDKVGILLTTEKPIYQPAQTIHVRALTLDRASHHAAANRKLTLELEDSRGNKVFRRAVETDAYGIASAEFALADEVNLGAYHLRAILGDAANPTGTQELTLQVERYVLPKFRVAIELAQKNGKPRRDYRPGDHVTGTVRANYFFGKPVENAPVQIVVQGLDVSLFTAAHAQGSTNAAGDYRFDIALPNYMAGRKQSQGAAPVLIEATVKDSAGHAETRGEGVTVSQSPLLLTAVPEGGALVSGMENQVYVLASYPDGAPAESQLAVRFGAQPVQHIATDKGGVAILRVTPSAQGDASLHIEADDRHGSRAASNVNLQTREGDDQLLLRLPHAVYKPGDNLSLTVYSTRPHGTAYIDLVKDGQTILTRDVEIVNGRADLSLRATPQMAGTLSVTAYVLGRDAQTIEDHRMVFVQPADELHIQATADAASYLPGAEARVHFHVTNARGEGVQAALGLEVVDEAVFALADKQPGFAKIFFYLEQELLKPRYEIHSLSLNEAVNHGQSDDRAAQALFSAAGTVDLHTLRVEAGQRLPMERAAEFHQRYQSAFEDELRTLLLRLPPEGPQDRDFTQRFDRIVDENNRGPRDAWGTPLRVDPPWQGARRRSVTASYYRIRSAGPDRQFDTADDLSAMVESRLGDLYPTQHTGSMELRIEHDRGPATALTEIAGVVMDQTGAIVPGAAVRLHRLDAAATRSGASNRDGAFTLSALPAGRYRLEIVSPGFETSAQEFTLAPRDRAVIRCTLQLGAVMEAVTVTGAMDMVETADATTVMALPLNNRNFAAVAAAPQPMARAMGMAAGLGRTRAAADAAPEAHVRSYFPEALYINPEIVTDGRGDASIAIPVADSITTWRMAMFASTQSGALGSGTSSLKVFQDFFVDLDLPVTLTQGDRVTLPVAVYNYSGARGDVSLSLEKQDWFDLVDDASEKTVAVDAGKVGGSEFTLQVKRLGKFKLTLVAHMHGASNRQDTVVREIEVVPNGQQQEIVFNGRLDSGAGSAAQHVVRFPQDALPDAGKLYVRLYPGPLSQVIEGMDGILRMPGGCFEQTSSSTYPNVLALDYMKRTKKLTPEIHAKAEGYIANGYQRLLTFEVPGGGFSWFGQAPANKILTAYGLMEFRDMSRVYDVDPRLIERTAQWLASQQQPDGSWKPDTQFINEGATNRYNSDVLRITAYLAWALENSGSQQQAVQRATSYIAQHLDSGKTDPYTLAVLANFAVEADKNSELTHHILQLLTDARIQKGERAWWASAETGVYSSGESAAVETTGLAIQALLKSGQYPQIVRHALAWLLEKKGANGNWGTTQATIMALRALLAASEASGSDALGTVDVLLNGKTVQTLAITAENNDLLHQFALPQVAASEDNHVELRFTGSGSMAYQVAGRYFTPWPAKAAKEALSIDVAYDRTRLAQNDIVTATATVHSNLDKTANMVMVDLGIPPGFELQSEDLQSIVEKTAHARTGRLEKFSLTATQAILYLDSVGAGETLHLNFRLRAKYPIRAKNFASRVYEYYDPAVGDTAKPVQFEVTAK
ncbi:Alpha-2-macroglobulin family N-terminal region [Granulicella rosea]|uniref:Alpha-2-macroglobulin family N-terminal region n=1 Tax=Granulicella rosea TaxID=474952 RepID=A0A239MHV1_9BACT|nr:MG2 domain-containing protein [Granulicella rosea]SNT42236.1 Alpha-2-macroglobulin family N-terminal region [Granulicella rosea]